ncbi:transcription factor TFIIIC subunit tfc4 [Ceratobasidium sp. 428]|nr:transcription factor TFIIIC subunit tfc4 [Ceratobasidium sp. 428]
MEAETGWEERSSDPEPESGLDSEEWEGSKDDSDEQLDPKGKSAARFTRNSSKLADGSTDTRENIQIRSEFDRLMEDIKTTNESTQSLGKAWDFTIADNDADNFDLQDELRQAAGIGKRQKGKGRARGPRRVHMSQEVKYFLGQANDAYASGDRATAIKIFQDVIAIEPGIPSAWSTLALCHEEAGDEARALQLRIMAAHLASEADTWVELGLSSRELGSMEQAVYCYRNAARLDKTNPDILWDYAFCLRESGQIQKAIKTYDSILQLLPHDLTILAQLRDLLVQTGSLARAAELYSAAFEYHLANSVSSQMAQGNIAIDPLLESTAEPDSTCKLGTREIAALADLLSGLGEHARAVEVVMRGARWLGQISDRGDADSIDEELDVNLRMRLAVAKLRSGDYQIGTRHASTILAHDINEFYELHTELADVYFEIGTFADAVAIYERLACQPHTSSLHVLSQIGACYRQLKNYPAARDVYQRIIDVDPDVHDAKMKLAEIYDIMNEKRLALNLVNEVIKAREQIQLRATTSESPVPPDTSLFAERSQAAGPTPKKSAPKTTITPAEAQRLDREHTDTVIRGFKKLKEADAGDICLDPAQEEVGRWDGWLAVAEELARIFMDEKRLFIVDRYKEFAGLKRKPRKNKNDEDVEMSCRYTRTQSSCDIYYKLPRDPTGRVATISHQGVDSSFLKVILLLISMRKYAFVVTKHRGRYADANNMLNKLSLSNAYQGWRNQNSIWLALLTIAVHEWDAKSIVEYGRKMVGRYQFSNDALRLFLASLGGGLAAAEAFVDSALQKFLFREMTLFERAAKGEPATFVGGGRNRWDFGSGKGDNEDDDDAEPAAPAKASSSAAASNPSPVLPTKESPVYISAYAQISGGTRSYQTEIYYLFKAYDLEPNDPVICLSLGTACIGRSMQRQADNRNHMVAQGFAFLHKYRTLRGGDGPLQMEEVDYNIGRGFHQLGLHAFAQKHYKAVLESVEKRQKVDPQAPLGIARETAYNLSLIYVVSGSPLLARDLYRTWLSF